MNSKCTEIVLVFLELNNPSYPVTVLINITLSFPGLHLYIENSGLYKTVCKNLEFIRGLLAMAYYGRSVQTANSTCIPVETTWPPEEDTPNGPEEDEWPYGDIIGGGDVDSGGLINQPVEDEWPKPLDAVGPNQPEESDWPGDLT
ncbi:F6 [Felid gammaherpesvirus 1]|uniref:F6 n=1 Tax=Felid gammaherpesvirus 1 TaxID=2560468 RepID=A0A0M3T958_9GAMA|nr:F6 [Felis catus gammaherpesvirus 1]ALE14712.1 F6 [Felis catus gammaherpesvirus 1]